MKNKPTTLFRSLELNDSGRRDWARSREKTSLEAAIRTMYDHRAQVIAKNSDWFIALFAIILFILFSFDS